MAWLDERKSGTYIVDRTPRVCIPLGRISSKDAKAELRKFQQDKDEDRVHEGQLGKKAMDIYDQYVTFLTRNNYSPKTIRAIHQDVLPFVKTIKRIKELIPTRHGDPLKAWKSHLESYEYREGKKYAIDTIAHRLRQIKAFCSWMVDEKILKRTPFELTIPEGRDDAGRALQGSQVHALFDHWPKQNTSGGRVGKQTLSKLFFQLVFFGGARLTELLGDEEYPEAYPGAQYEDLDRKSGILKLAKTKAGKDREMALPKEIVGKIPADAHGPIFKGKITEWTLRKHLATAKQNAKITGRLRVHDGRVSSATEWLRKNKDIKSAMDQYGWKHERMALHYNKVATEERVEQAQRITYK